MKHSVCLSGMCCPECMFGVIQLLRVPAGLTSLFSRIILVKISTQSIMFISSNTQMGLTAQRLDLLVQLL